MIKKRKFCLFFKNLPRDIFIEILCLLNPGSIQNANMVSKYFYEFMDDTFWKKYFMIYFSKTKVDDNIQNWKQHFKDVYHYFCFSTICFNSGHLIHKNRVTLSEPFSSRFDFFRNIKMLGNAIYEWKLKIHHLKEIKDQLLLIVGISAGYDLYRGSMNYPFYVKSFVKEIIINANLITNIVEIKTIHDQIKYKIDRKINYYYMGIRAFVPMDIEIIEGTIKLS